MNKRFFAAFAVMLLILTNTAFAQAPPAAPPPPAGLPPPPAPPPDSNLSVGKHAYQSSTLSWFDASLAVDGIRTNALAYGSTSATTLEYNAWWAVDLGATHEIHNMYITFGATALFNVPNYGRYLHYGIFAWNDAESYWYLIKDVDALTGEVGIGFRPNTKTRYVLIQILSPAPDYLELAEVRILGQ